MASHFHKLVNDVVQVQKAKQRFHEGDSGDQLGANWNATVDRLLGPSSRLADWRNSSRSRQDNHQNAFDPDKEDYTNAEMNEFDEKGWAHIHQAAYQGYVKSLGRFVSTDPNQLELETTDDLHSTPLLLAVMSGNLETVKCLVELGARVHATNSQNHGVVELCAFRQSIPILEYFIRLNDEKLPVWRNLIRFLASELDKECEEAAKCLRLMTEPTPDGLNPYWRPLFENGVVPAIVRIIKGGVGDQARVATIQMLLNLLPAAEVREQFVGLGGMAALVRLLKASGIPVIRYATEAVRGLVAERRYAELAVKDGAIPALVRVVQNVRDADCVTQVMIALGAIVGDDPSHQQAVSSYPGAVQSMVGLYEGQNHKRLLVALTDCVARIASGSESIQNAFVDEGVANPIVDLIRSKSVDLQLSAVACVHRLVDGNPHTQRAVVQVGVVHPMMQLLKKSRQPHVQELTAGALWALAGDDVEEKRSMASMMGVQLVIEFLSSLSDILHYIGSEAMAVLASGPLGKQEAIAQANGVHPCVRLLRADREHIVLSVIRTISTLCVATGFVPQPRNQTTVAQSRGIKLLVALMVHSKNEYIQAEAAHTLGSVTLGHQANMEELAENVDFSYVRILKMMYAEGRAVRLTAGSALAVFAYNSLTNQKEISDQGGVRFNCFVPFLESFDEYERCCSAFQVVVLARIIPDEEQAISSATGIKLLVDLLRDSSSDQIVAMSCDCIARLSHTRAGIPAAFVSIDTVNYLCDKLASPVEHVRGSAAIALGYLSFNHHANRQLLNRCRVDPVMMRVLRYYTQRSKLSPEFIEGWRHYKQIGLPPIEEGRLNLVGKKSIQYKDFVGRPLTITSIEETTGGSTNIQNSPAALQASSQLNPEDDKTHLTARSSRRSSRISHTSMASHGQTQLSPGQGQLSVSSPLSRQNSMLSVAGGGET